jgi:hypothetical protein
MKRGGVVESDFVGRIIYTGVGDIMMNQVVYMGGQNRVLRITGVLNYVHHLEF